MIEAGRHNKIPKESRFCPFCPKSIENESHFLFECSVYQFQQEKLLHHIISAIPGFEYFPEGLKLEYMLTDYDFNVCTYIANCSELRQFLLSNPKGRLDVHTIHPYFANVATTYFKILHGLE